MASDIAKVYTKSWLAEFFHGFEHINFSFDRVNSTFAPDDLEYRQSLVFLALIPIAVCVLLWLVYLVYFCVRWCQPQQPVLRPKDEHACCSKGLLVILLLIAIGLTGFGFYENNAANDGIDDVDRAVLNINDSISSASDELSHLDSLADDLSNNLLVSLEALVQAVPDNSTRTSLLEILDQMKEETVTVRAMITDVEDIQSTQDVLQDVHEGLNDFETYRYLITIAVLVIYMIQFVLMLLGVVKRSKSTLILNATFGVLLAIVYWASTGFYLGITVGIGDFCYDPNGYFVSSLADSSKADTLVVYVECTDPSLPYQKVILEAQAAVTKASTDISTFTGLAGPYDIPALNQTVEKVEQDLVMAQGNLSSILSGVGMCTNIHNLYIDGVNAVCIDTLSSLALLLLITALLAWICVLVILLASCVWRNIKRRPRQQQPYLSRDETDPFLPHPPPYESEYGSTYRGATPRAWSDRAAMQAQYGTAASPYWKGVYSFPPYSQPRSVLDQVNHLQAVARSTPAPADHSPPQPVNEDQVMIMRHHQQSALARNESPPPAYHSGQFSAHEVEEALSSNYGRPRN